MGHTETKQLFFDYLKFRFNCVSYSYFLLNLATVVFGIKKEKMWSIPYTKIIVTDTTITFLSHRCSKESVTKVFRAWRRGRRGCLWAF